jgi:hypothetical protein
MWKLRRSSVRSLKNCSQWILALDGICVTVSTCMLSLTVFVTKCFSEDLAIDALKNSRCLLIRHPM